MEVKQINPNPTRSKQSEQQTINNPYQPISPFIPFVRGMNQATRAMIDALPYGDKTVQQEMINANNQKLAMGTRNQQMFGTTIYSQDFPGMPRN